MSSYRKNILVGVTVLGSLIILAWMIMKFGSAPALLIAPRQMPIRFVSDRADGLDEGSAISYLGVKVGQITNIQRSTEPDRLNVVYIDARVDEQPPLPANLQGIIRPGGLIGGGASVSLELTGPQAQGTLKKDARLPAHFKPIQLLPPEFAKLAEDLRQTSRQLRESHLFTDLDRTVKTTEEQIKKAGDVMEKAGTAIDSLQKVIGDQTMQTDLKTTVANLKKFSTDLNKLSAQASGTIDQTNKTLVGAQNHIDDLSKQLSSRLEQVAGVLDSFQSISKKIDHGKGTAGLLVNDPKLYQGLVDTTRQLNATITDLKRLVDQWEQEGVYLKLK